MITQKLIGCLFLYAGLLTRLRDSKISQLFFIRTTIMRHKSVDTNDIHSQILADF